MKLQENNLPLSWTLISLDNLVKVNPTLDKKQYEDNLEVSFVPMPAVEAENGKIDVTEIKQFSDVKKGYTAFQERDVLFAKITPCMENGKMAIVPSVKNNLGFGSTEFHVLRSYTGISPEYIYYYVSSKLFRMEAEHNMTGAVGQRRVPAPWLSAVKTPLPPVNEQTRIVAKIEEIFSELDKGIESLKTAREQLKVYRQALLKNAFEGKLTEQWRKENADKLETADQLLERIKQEREKRCQQQLDEWKEAIKQWEADGKKGKKPTTPKQTPEIKIGHLHLSQAPAGWAFVEAVYVCDFITKGTTPEKKELYSGSGEIPFIKVYNLTKNGQLDFSIDPTYVSKETHSNFLSRSVCKSGDVLMNIVGPPLGKVSVVPDEHKEWNINQAIARYRTGVINSKFLSDYLLSESVVRSMMGKAKATVGQFNLTLEICREVLLPICSMSEQEKINELLDTRLSVVDKIDADIEINLALSEALRQSILKKAFSGKLVPQDPDDEPASVLLERIAAEKAATAQATAAAAKTKKTKGKAA